MAEAHLGRLVANGCDAELSISEVREFASGWVFYYGAQDPAVRLAGNAPILVPKKGGEVYFVGYNRPIEESMAVFERFGDPNALACAEVRIPGYDPGADIHTAIKLIRDECGVGLAVAKQVIENSSRSEFQLLATRDIPSARSRARKLSACGIVAEAAYGI